MILIILLLIYFLTILLLLIYQYKTQKHNSKFIFKQLIKNSNWLIYVPITNTIAVIIAFFSYLYDVIKKLFNNKN